MEIRELAFNCYENNKYFNQTSFLHCVSDIYNLMTVKIIDYNMQDHSYIVTITSYTAWGIFSKLKFFYLPVRLAWLW